MSSRDLQRWLVMVAGVLGLAGVLMAALPNSTVVGSGTAGLACGGAQTLFSVQTCNVPTLAAGSDEFNSSASSADWTVISNRSITNVDSSAFLPYSYAGTTNLYSFSGYRAGWLMVQPDAGNAAGVRTAIGFYRAITPTNDMTVYSQVAILSRMAQSSLSGSVRLMLTDSSTTNIDALVGAGCNYDYRNQEIAAFTDVGATAQSYNTASVAVFARYDDLYLHRSGTGVWCWAGTDDGLTSYAATTTKTLTYTRLWILFFSGEASGGPGASIAGVNYVRIVANQRFLP